MKKYDIAAYVWPAYTGDEPRTRIFWPEGIGEWQSVKNAEKKGVKVIVCHVLRYTPMFNKISSSSLKFCISGSIFSSLS